MSSLATHKSAAERTCRAAISSSSALTAGPVPTPTVISSCGREGEVYGQAHKLAGWPTASQAWHPWCPGLASRHARLVLQ